jgi:hypothetical protein
MFTEKSVSAAIEVLISTDSEVTVLSEGSASVMSVVSKPTLHIPRRTYSKIK